VIAKHFNIHYSGLQCHTILQKSFLNADMIGKKKYLLLVLKTVLLNIFFFQDSLTNSKEFQKNSIYLKYKSFAILNAFIIFRTVSRAPNQHIRINSEG